MMRLWHTEKSGRETPVFFREKEEQRGYADPIDRAGPDPRLFQGLRL